MKEKKRTHGQSMPEHGDTSSSASRVPVVSTLDGEVKAYSSHRSFSPATPTEDERRAEEDYSDETERNENRSAQLSESRSKTPAVQGTTSSQGKTDVWNLLASPQEEDEWSDERRREEELKDSGHRKGGVYTFRLPSFVCGTYSRYPCFCHAEPDSLNNSPVTAQAEENERQEEEWRSKSLGVSGHPEGEKKGKNRFWCCRVLYVAQSWAEVQELLFGTSFRRS